MLHALLHLPKAGRHKWEAAVNQKEAMRSEAAPQCELVSGMHMSSDAREGALV